MRPTLLAGESKYHRIQSNYCRRWAPIPVRNGILTPINGHIKMGFSNVKKLNPIIGVCLPHL